MCWFPSLAIVEICRQGLVGLLALGGARCGAAGWTALEDLRRLGMFGLERGVYPPGILPGFIACLLFHMAGCGATMPTTKSNHKEHRPQSRSCGDTYIHTTAPPDHSLDSSCGRCSSTGPRLTIRATRSMTPSCVTVQTGRPSQSLASTRNIYRHQSVRRQTKVEITFEIKL